MKTLFITFLALFMIIIPGASYPFVTSNLMLLEIFIIGVPSFFLSLQQNDKRVEGKFISYVMSKSIPGAILMLFSVSCMMLAEQLLSPIYSFSPEIYSTLMIFAMSTAGLIMLFRICQPFNVFRGVLFSLIFVAFTSWVIFSLARGDNMFLHTVALSPSATYWHHIMLLVTLIIADIPLSSWLIKITDGMRNKKPE